MSATARRIVLYATGLAVVAAGLWLKYGYEVAPDAGVRLNGAALVAQLGQYDEALKICEVVLEEHPDSLEARIYKAAFLAAARRHEEALAAYDDALDHASGEDVRFNLRQDRASVLLSLGRMEEFKDEREKLAAAGADDRVHLLDALVASRRGDHAATVEAYTRAHELRPDDEHVKARLWKALMQRGDAALAARRFEEAQGAFDAACLLFETATNAHLKAAEVRLASGDPATAARILRDLEPGTPGAAPLLFRTATALLEKDKRNDALDALEAAFAADREGVRVLLSKDETWARHLKHPRVRALLEQSSEEKKRDRLTGS